MESKSITGSLSSESAQSTRARRSVPTLFYIVNSLSRRLYETFAETIVGGRRLATRYCESYAKSIFLIHGTCSYVSVKDMQFASLTGIDVMKPMDSIRLSPRFEEIIELSINDPHLTAIYRSFDLRYLRNEYDERDMQVLASKMYASLVGEDVHTHWRKLIASHFFETRDPEKLNPELTIYRIEVCNNCKLTLRYVVRATKS